VNKVITVREYATLTLSEGEATLDRHTIPKPAFDWLLEEQAKFFKNGQPILSVAGKKSLKLESYVGYLQSPCGTEIEILPKTTYDVLGDVAAVRRTVCDMIYTYLGNKERSYSQANLELFKKPVSEFIITQFLEELNMLIRKGLRNTYVRIEEESRFLRGQLNVAKQIRQPVSRAHYLQINFDMFTVDRPANRLIRTALVWIVKNTKTSANWRLANELFHQTQEIPTSVNIPTDFKAWPTDKLMESYKAIRIWTELILYKQNPTTQRGNHTGIALLFPMEYLFEDYVAFHLRKKIPANWRLSTQIARESLIEEHEGSSMFKLKPDLLLEGPNKQIVVLDTKWKLLDTLRLDKKYWISQADMYQMFAYGRKYLPEGKGCLYLIYPKHEMFQTPLKIFHFEDELTLEAIPFDLPSKQFCPESILARVLGSEP
jgi:5-methylcytosine-specific restriction enzyme subunit McrC